MVGMSLTVTDGSDHEYWNNELRAEQRQRAGLEDE